jgi:hypothetical protein
MDYLGVVEIPKRHILKRWTRDARDVLPGHLEVYQNDHASSRSFTYRHSLLYKKSLELVRLGDASAEAYEKLDSLFESNLLIMAPFDNFLCLNMNVRTYNNVTLFSNSDRKQKNKTDFSTASELHVT